MVAGESVVMQGSLCVRMRGRTSVYRLRGWGWLESGAQGLWMGGEEEEKALPRGRGAVW